MSARVRAVVQVERDGHRQVAAISRNIAYRTGMPIDFTVLTDVWMMTGARTSSAAASTASRVRSLTMLMAATP